MVVIREDRDITTTTAQGPSTVTTEEDTEIVGSVTTMVTTETWAEMVVIIAGITVIMDTVGKEVTITEKGLPILTTLIATTINEEIIVTTEITGITEIIEIVLVGIIETETTTIPVVMKVKDEPAIGGWREGGDNKLRLRPLSQNSLHLMVNDLQAEDLLFYC